MTTDAELRSDTDRMGRYLRGLIALVSLGAGGIHFAVAGEHFAVETSHGVFFVVLGWLQVVFALAIVLVPSRRLLLSGIALNAAVVAVWAISRTFPSSVGPITPEAVGAADLCCSVFEVAVVGAALALLWQSVARRPVRSLTAVPLVAVVGLAVAVMSGLSLSPALASAEDSHSHSHAGGTTTAAGHGHAVGAATLTGATPCEQSGPPTSAGQTHGHRGPFPWTSIADPATRALLTTQLAQAHAVTVQYPTVKEAEAAGYRMTTPYVACIGAHYLNPRYLVGAFDPTHPAMLLYDGTRPDSKIVGLSYALLSGAKPPDGFAGPNDIWHQHNLNGGLCLRGGVVVGAESTSADECAARGGRKIALSSLWMMHAWVADGWPSSWGIFSAEHPDLGRST